LQGDWSEILRATGVVFFWEKDKERAVDARKIGAVCVEGSKKID
jgi:hypothetical protein